MIHAPDAVVSLWEKEADRALAAADRADDLTLELRLSCAAPEVRELVTDLASALTRAASILAGSVIHATSEGPEVFFAGVDRLARELDGDFSCCAGGDDGCEGDIAHHDLNSDPR